MAIQSSIILRLIDKIPDEELRRQITAQYYEDVEKQVDFVQGRLGILETDLRETLQNSLGETNNMISEVINISRHADASREVLYQKMEQGFLGIENRFGEIDARIESIGTDTESLHQEVDRHFAEVNRHTSELLDLKKMVQDLELRLSAFIKQVQ